ncbi:uncharacterized protein LOC143600555 [Bidens hawaiensis]|uniref:uncharacterized protein LOC143600555 n=1 Tax=Bidens hawaiensis TaxID=980011 RepID=UPI0040490A4D
MDSPTSIYNQLFGPDQQVKDDAEEEAVTSAIVLATTYMNSISSSPPPVMKRTHIERDHICANNRLIADYFNDSSKYKNPKTFRRRFRMSKDLFMRITKYLERELDYFKQKTERLRDARIHNYSEGNVSHTVLTYENTSDIDDEYLNMAIKQLGTPWSILVTPNWNDLQRLYEAHARMHGLRGMIGSVYCMHQEWANFSTSWRGQYTRGDQKGSTISLQAIASYGLWIWSAFFGVPDSNNGIIVLE